MKAHAMPDQLKVQSPPAARMRPSRWGLLACLTGLVMACAEDRAPRITAPTANIDVLDDTLDSRNPSGAPVDFGLVGANQPVDFAMMAMVGGSMRIYKDHDAWSFGGGRDQATLVAMGKVLNTDFFVHPMTALGSGIPAGTDVVLMTANSTGGPASFHQRSAAAQSALSTFASGGGIVLIDLADNEFSEGYRAPGATGTPSYVFPDGSQCRNASLTAAAFGSDATPGTSDDHPFVKGPDGLAGTADDMTNTRIDMFTSCWIVHGNLADGFSLPAGATVLATVNFYGVNKPVLAEYCLGSGRVIVNTFTLGFVGHQPQPVSGPGKSFIQENLFSYALSGAAQCNAAPTSDAGGPYTGNEGSAVQFDGSASSDPDGDALTYSWDFGDGNTGTGQAPTHAYGDNGVYTVTLTVDDGNGATDVSTTSATIANVAPSLGALVVPANPLALVSGGTSVNVSAPYTDPGTLDTHTGSLSCDGGVAGAVTAASGSAAGSCTFTAAGVYTVSMTVTDDDGDSDTETASAYIVIYDPSAGFVTGGGWILSDAGSYADDVALSGKATFGFVSKYQKGATVPVGNTEFQFHAGAFEFKSDSYQWLVIAGARAQYKGVGQVKGRAGTYGFLVTAIDGAVSGGGGVDKFRIKVWDAVSGTVVYDNRMGDAEDSGDATALGGGSIVVHAK